MKRCLGCMEIYDDKFDICPHCGYLEGTEVEEAIHMSPGTLLGDRYIVGKVLGFGGFGVTYLGWDGKLEQKVAIKEYLPSEFSTRMPGQSRVTVFNGDKSEQFYDGLNKFVEEAKRLAKFQNEAGIVKVFDSFVENDTAYIIMEFLDGETLASYMKREGTIPEDKAVEMLMPIMESLEVVHQEGVLHRDIAPDNIFITKSGEIKLIDFGASRYATTSHSRSLTVIIKPGYSPEEQYRSTGDQGPHTDVYALGACLYKMVTGKTPPDALERRAKFEGQNKDILESPRKINKHVSQTRENAILNAMNVRIEDRTPTMRELIGELNSVLPVKRKNGRIKKIDIYGWPWWFKGLAVAAILAITTVATLMATGVIRVEGIFADGIVVPEGMVVVPELEGLSNEKAAKKVESSNLKYMIAGSVTSEYIEAGKIVLQNPVSGMYYAEGSVVEMYVSKGTGEVIVVEDGRATVPFVIGSTEEEAITDLSAAGLGTPTITYEYSETVGAGLVISQSEDLGKKVEQGTVLSLVVSKGTKPIKMPNVEMTLREDAERTIKELGLKVEVTIVETPDYAQNRVIKQSIKEGTEVKKNDTVTLTVAKAIWSEWSTTPPTLGNGQVMEQKTQYSYSTRQWTTQDDQSALVGWTLDESKNQIFYVDGQYTDWSSWSTDVATATDTRKIEIKNEQRYKDKHEVNGTTTPTPAGYTQTAEWWGDWISCGADVVGSGTREVRTEQVYVKTQYKYDHYHKYETNSQSTSPVPYSGWVYHETIWLDAPLAEDGTSSAGGKKYTGAGGGDCTRHNWWYNQKTNDIYNTLYYYRDKYFSYYKWSGWSEWKEEAYSASDTRKVEARTLYRYADKIPHTRYTFYRWTEFTPFSDQYVEANADCQVNKQELYRYMTK